MALQMKQALRQTQQLVMTPQLQQAIKLLQYNHLEMVEVLEQELRENPVLEVTSDDESLAGEQALDRNDLQALEDSTREVDNPNAELLEAAWEQYLEDYGGAKAPVDRDGVDRSPIENVSRSNLTLFRYLLEQLRLSALEELERKIALEIIGNLSEDGYLDLDLDQLAASFAVDKKEVLRVLECVQRFDPPGVAARDLRECMSLQARSLEPADDPIHQLAVSIIEDAFDLFERGKPDKVARRLKRSLEAVEEAYGVIAKLDPKPGRSFSNTDVAYVVPDIFVFKVGNEYTVSLNDDGLPRVRISRLYHNQLAGVLAHRTAKDYLQEKMRGATWLIRSIHQRQKTIQRVTRSIVRFQREFFDKGIDFLKPLVLKDVAADVALHESTVSRVTANKYVQTPRGIFELKYFFNSGIPHGEDSIASESVKNQIWRIIKNEDPSRPASDQQIVQELAAYEIRIARRTVAKYRELMGIPPSSKRKKRFRSSGSEVTIR